MLEQIIYTAYVIEELLQTQNLKLNNLKLKKEGNIKNL